MNSPLNSLLLAYFNWESGFVTDENHSPITQHGRHWCCNVIGIADYGSFCEVAPLDINGGEKSFQGWTCGAEWKGEGCKRAYLSIFSLFCRQWVMSFLHRRFSWLPKALPDGLRSDLGKGLCTQVQKRDWFGWTCADSAGAAATAADFGTTALLEFCLSAAKMIEWRLFIFARLNWWRFLLLNLWCDTFQPVFMDSMSLD